MHYHPVLQHVPMHHHNLETEFNLNDSISLDQKQLEELMHNHKQLEQQLEELMDNHKQLQQLEELMDNQKQLQQPEELMDNQKQLEDYLAKK